MTKQAPMTDSTGNAIRRIARESDEIPIISLHRPWVNWVLREWKVIETRTHKKLASLAGRRIGIHASLKWDLSATGAAAQYLTLEQRTGPLPNIGGAIVCTAFVEEHRKLTAKDSPLALIDCEVTERYGLILKDVQIIKPIPCKGKQGIWYDERLRASLEKMMREK